MTSAHWKPYNTDLYQATQQFVQAVIGLLSTTRLTLELSFEYRQRCDFKKLGSEQYIVTWYEPRFLLLNDIRDAISKLDETKQCAEIIRSDSEIDLEPFYDETNKIEWYLLPFFVRDLIDNDLEFDRIHENFDIAFEKLETFLYCRAYKYRLVAVLDGFTTSIPCARLSPSVTIQRIDDKDCLTMAETAVRKDESSPGYLQGHPVAVIIDCEKPKVPSGSNQWLDDEKTTAQNVVSALRLLQVSRVHIRAFFRLLITWQPYSENGFSLEDRVFGFMPDFHLEKDDFPQLLTLWKEIEVGSQAVTRLRIALDRYESTFETKDTAEQLIDAVIALESLYIQGGSELSHKLALRAATILGRDGKDREQIYGFIRFAYKMRSDFVHGSISGDDFQKKLVVKDSNGSKFINQLREYLRQTLRKFLVLFTQRPELASISLGNKEKLDCFLTSCVLCNAKFEEKQTE
jgi:hypothetical protein